ncbi:high affinity copper uptake protein 1-like isoform X2 [Ctenocephalides felis]|uniref:high affinity copper uptake protein 1-like isoform X2 n=1 Tax=Ctenocephalides felis TaxID=7515 RepID=UPI000E6E1A1A|nr:high affinity copper uptake protein 1-like isoform X2 [Ctenocephalides felis]
MNHSMMNHSMMDHSHHMAHDPKSSMELPVHNPPMDHTGHMHEDAAPNMEHDHRSGSVDHMMMSMVFHGGCTETILFSWWKTSTVAGLIGSMIAIFITAALYESLKYYRENLFWRTHNSLQYRAVAHEAGGGKRGAAASSATGSGGQAAGEDGRIVQQHMLSWMNVLQTILHAVQVTVSFLLMLVFMTYNYWLCLAVVAGASTGYFLFGWKKSVIVDVTEHCH